MGIHLPNQAGKAPTGTLNGAKLSMDVHVANVAPIPVISTSTSNGAPGAAIPAEATLVGGTDAGTLRAVAVSPTGQVQIDQLSTLATEATLASVFGDTTAIAASVATIDTTTQSIDGKTPALGQALMAGSVPVAIASDQSTLPVSAASLPLPTGAATEATLSAASAKLPAALGQAAMAASLAVVIASNQSAVPISNLPATADTAFGAVGASTVRSASIPGNAAGIADFNVGAIGAQTPRVAAMLGVGALAVSATNPVPVAASTGRSVTEFVRNDYTGTSVTTAAYVTLIASTAALINELEIFDSSGQTLKLALGAAAAEVDLLLVFPGGNGRIPVTIPAGTRVSIRAVSATASVGEFSANCYS